MQVSIRKPFKRKTDGRGNGKRKGQWVSRIRYRTDETQNWKTIERVFDTYGQALGARPKIEAEIRSTHGGFTRGEKMTFDDLAAHALATYYREAVIKNGVKVDGVKSTASVRRHLEPLKQHFGKKRISSITTGDLRTYRDWRSKLGSRRGKAGGELGKEISETTLNRELQTMRRMMKDAYAEGWIGRDPFVNAKVIKIANEKERSRILTANEEARLLAAAEGTRQTASKRTGKPIFLSVYNEYLRALIILAVDSAMRKSEILQLTWDDIDFDGNSVHVIAANSKTEREREVPLSSRANLELQMLPTFGNGGRVFPFEDFKRSWVTAKQLAEIDDLRFHDLRSTAITRMIDAGLPLPIVAKIAGHSLHTTTVRHYVNLDKDLTRRASDVIDSANKARAKAAIHMTEEFSDAGPILEAMFVN